MAAPEYSFLKVQGERVVDGAGTDVILRGAGLGGWMKSVSPSPPSLRIGVRAE